MPARLLTQSATITARVESGTDAMGAPTWSESTSVVACKLDPRGADDTWPAELVGKTVGMLFLDNDAPAVALNDTVLVDGREWRPVGVAIPHYGRQGSLDHWEIRVAVYEPTGEAA